jgi:hypothetical protein
VPILAKGLRSSGGNTIVDLASGGGGGWSKLTEHLIAEFPSLQVVLTDRFPNHDGFAAIVKENPSLFSFESNPVDARDVPAHLKGLRTQFLSFHHFQPDDARQILQNAVGSGQPIAIFEAQKRDVAHFFKFALSPIAVVLMTPFIRPFNWSRIVFTYLIPVIPLFTFWDGIVSVLRTYSVDELHEMVSSLTDTDSYLWEIGESKSGSVSVLYVVGLPK